MSLFVEHPCGGCEDYGKCEQFKCEKFTKWFNDTYRQMMVINTMYDMDRIAVDGKIKSEIDAEKAK